MEIIWLMMVNNNTGWWLTYPSEKYESQLGWWHSQYDGKTIQMFQTTKHVGMVIQRLFGLISIWSRNHYSPGVWTFAKIPDVSIAINLTDTLGNSPKGEGEMRWNDTCHVLSCHVITLACRVMSWHVGVGGFWLGHLAISDNGNLQVRFHDDIDGSSLARAIYASTGILPSTAVSPLTLVGSSSCTRRHAVPSKDPMSFRSSVGFQEFLFGILAHSRQSTHPLWQRGNGRMTKIGC